MNTAELVRAPHHELSYSEEDRRDVNSFTLDEILKFDKQAAVHYSRALGLQETGMSVNEVALLYDLLEKKGACNIVELGRNYACSTRLFLQHVLRRGGFLESWDLKHWGDVHKTFSNQGFEVQDVHGDYFVQKPGAGEPTLAWLRIADSRKDNIMPRERWVDFLLIDTEHGMEDALGEYMRWRPYLKGGAMVAFHDSTLPGVKRAIEVCVEVEDKASPGRIVRQWQNEREDGFGVAILEWKG